MIAYSSDEEFMNDDPDVDKDYILYKYQTSQKEGIIIKPIFLLNNLIYSNLTFQLFKKK